MNEVNNETSQTELEINPTEAEPLTKSSRIDRLLASIIDAILMTLVTLPVMYLSGGFDGLMDGVQHSWLYSIFLGVVSIVVFIAINISSLKKSGQTLGKKAIGIKVVTSDGGLPSLSNHFLKRYAMYFLPGYVPLGGQLVSLINVLFIFGKEKRCIHDYVADTVVVDC